MIDGILHVHSSYSDGEFSLEELRDELLRAGYSFACLTDHSQYFDTNRLSSYTAECEALSDQRFLFIPGLEFECRARRIHILGLGVESLVDSDDPDVVLDHIRTHGGFSVIAHPKDVVFGEIEDLTTLPDGIEVWNSKYDGRYAPRPQSFALLSRLQARDPSVRAMYGQDLHFKGQHRGLYNRVSAGLRRDEILEALSVGAYTGVKGEVLLPSDGSLNEDLGVRFAAAQSRSRRLRAVMREGKAAFDRLGLPIPRALKSQLRRIF